MTSQGNERAAAMTPVAASLVDAVRRQDAAAVERCLAGPNVDWPALAVVLADLARPTVSEHYIGHLLHDLATSDGTKFRTIARRYGITEPQLRAIAADNGIEPSSPRQQLADGAWVQRGLVQVWKPRTDVA